MIWYFDKNVWVLRFLRETTLLMFQGAFVWVPALVQRAYMARKYLTLSSVLT